MKVKRSRGERKDRKDKYEVNTHSRSNDRKLEDPRNKIKELVELHLGGVQGRGGHQPGTAPQAAKELGEDRRRHSHSRGPARGGSVPGPGREPRLMQSSRRRRSH